MKEIQIKARLIEGNFAQGSLEEMVETNQAQKIMLKENGIGYLCHYKGMSVVFCDYNQEQYLKQRQYITNTIYSLKE